MNIENVDEEEEFFTRDFENLN